MDLHRDIQPLTDFKCNTSKFLDQLEQNGQPLVLTINGKAERVVRGGRSQRRLLDLAEKMETIQSIREGLASRKWGDSCRLEEA
jgi:hypothetical protein